MTLEQLVVKITADTKDLDKGVDEASSKLDRLSGKASQVSRATSKISIAAAGALTAITGLAISAGQWADELSTLSRNLGLSTTKLQEFQYVAEEIDVSVDTVASGMQRLVGNLDGQADTWARLGVNVKDAAGQYKDTEIIFDEVMQALGGVENETERLMLAQNLFGRNAGLQLQGIYNDYAKYQDLVAQYSDYIVSQEEIDNLNAFNDRLDNMKMKFKAVMAVNAAKALDALRPVLEDLINLVLKGLDVISKLTPGQIKFAAGVLAVVASISPIASIVAKITGTVTKLMPILTKVGAFAAANPIALIAAAVIGLSLLLAEKGDELPEFIDSLIQKITDKLPDVIQSGVELVMSLITGLISSVPTLIAAIPTLVFAIIDAFMAVDWKQLGIDIILAIINGINGQDAGSETATTAQDICDEFGEIDWIQVGADIWAGIKLGLFGGDGQNGADAGRKLANDTLGGYRKVMRIKSPSKAMKELGQYTTEGLAEGIAEDGNAIAAVKNVSNDLVSAFNPELTATNAVQSTVELNGNYEGFAALASIGQQLLHAVQSKDTEITLDGMQLARALQPYNNRVTTLTGSSLITV